MRGRDNDKFFSMCFSFHASRSKCSHHGYFEKFIERLGEWFNIWEIAFDRWGAVKTVQNLEGMGFTVVPFEQGVKYMLTLTMKSWRRKGAPPTVVTPSSAG